MRILGFLLLALTTPQKKLQERPNRPADDPTWQWASSLRPSDQPPPHEVAPLKCGSCSPHSCKHLVKSSLRSPTLRGLTEHVPPPPLFPKPEKIHQRPNEQAGHHSSQIPHPGKVLEGESTGLQAVRNARGQWVALLLGLQSKVSG